MCEDVAFRIESLCLSVCQSIESSCRLYFCKWSCLKPPSHVINPYFQTYQENTHQTCEENTHQTYEKNILDHHTSEKIITSMFLMKVRLQRVQSTGATGAAVGSSQVADNDLLHQTSFLLNLPTNVDPESGWWIHQCFQSHKAVVIEHISVSHPPIWWLYWLVQRGDLPVALLLS